MKRTSIVLIAFCLIASMVGCGNMSVGIGNYQYKKVHIDTYHYSGCLTVESWYDCGNGIEVKTKEVGSVFLSEGIYALIEKECPFCCHEEVECEVSEG